MDDCDVIKCIVEGMFFYFVLEIILVDFIGLVVDIWVCGVILFLLFVGYFLFWYSDDRKLMLFIVEGCYSLFVCYWDCVLDDVKDFVK